VVVPDIQHQLGVSCSKPPVSDFRSYTIGNLVSILKSLDFDRSASTYEEQSRILDLLEIF
jgi:hypothetical protein